LYVLHTITEEFTNGCSHLFTYFIAAKVYTTYHREGDQVEDFTLALFVDTIILEDY